MDTENYAGVGEIGIISTYHSRNP